MTRIDLFNLSATFRRYNQSGAGKLLEDAASQEPFTTSPLSEALFAVLKHIAEILSYR